MSFVFLNARKCHFATPVMFHFAKIKTFESQKSKIFLNQKFCLIILSDFHISGHFFDKKQSDFADIQSRERS